MKTIAQSSATAQLSSNSGNFGGSSTHAISGGQSRHSHTHVPSSQVSFGVQPSAHGSHSLMLQAS